MWKLFDLDVIDFYVRIMSYLFFYMEYSFIILLVLLKFSLVFEKFIKVIEKYLINWLYRMFLGGSLFWCFGFDEEVNFKYSFGIMDFLVNMILFIYI